MIAFGISSLFFAILGVFVPFFGIFISGLSGFLAWMTTGKGIPLGAAAIIINLINIFLLSPGYMLVVGLEAQYRTPDQNKTLYIWMVVLFLQISALGIYVVNYGLVKIDFGAIKRAFKKEKSKKDFSKRNEPTVADNGKTTLSESIRTASIEDRKMAVSPLTQALNIQTHGGIKQDSKLWRSELKNDRNLLDIPFDGSRTHDTLLKQNKTLLKTFSIVVSCIFVAFLLAILRPDLFSFLKYSNVFKATSKTLSEKTLDQVKNGQTQSSVPTINDTKRNEPIHSFSNNSREFSEPQVSHPPQIGNDNTVKEGYWYIIKLKSGETILTQDAVITRDFVSILSLNGQERRISKKDMDSFRRTKI